MYEICHICGKESEFYCRQCDECVCEECTVPYTQYNQIDYTLCNNCGDVYDENMYDAYKIEEKIKEEREKKRILKNQKQRAYYHSDKAKEKRELKKIEREKIRREHELKEAEFLVKIIKDITLKINP